MPRGRPSTRPLFIALVTLGGALLCAIPFLGGLIGIIAGITAISSDRREKKWALLHTSELPLRRIAELVPGAGVRLQGRVVSRATVTAPISGRPAVYAVLTGTSSVVRNENERRLPPKHFGEVIEIDDGSGRAEIPLRNVHLLSRHVERHVEHNQGRLPALREVISVPEDHLLEVEEMRLEPDDELWIHGRVEAVEDAVLEQPEGYRTSAARKRVRVSGDDAQELRLTNLRPEELERVLAMSPGFVTMGVVWLIAAALSLAYWGWRFFS